MSKIEELLVPGELKIGTFVDLEGIESAITSTAFAAKDADGVTLLILQKHLKKMCNIQRAAFSASVGGEGQ